MLLIIKNLVYGAGAAYTLIKVASLWFNRWGATAAERWIPFPGTDALDHPQAANTHAITIEAPPSAVWPWLIQMGVGRGGFYSYSWLENLVGCGVKNLAHIAPELQDLKVGDRILLHPRAPPLTVTHLEVDRVLALEGWIFYLKPLNRNRTRLLIRTYRTRRPAAQGSFLITILDFVLRTVIYDLAHFVMGRKQMKEIKRLAEGPDYIRIAQGASKH